MKSLAIRYAVTASVLILLACESNVSDKSTSLKSGKPIKRIMETIHDAYDSEGAMAFKAETSMHSAITRSFFDKNSNVISKQIFDYKGAPQWRLLYKYDSRGNTIETSVYQYSEVLLSKRMNKFDDTNKLIESSVLDGNDLSFSIRYENEITFDEDTALDSVDAAKEREYDRRLRE